MSAAPSTSRSRVEDIFQRLGRLHPKVIDLSLGRIERLLDALGRPQDRLPPVLHVAGTNGKGSVVATARAIAEAAGYRVHVYTSPHLVRFNERIRLAGRLIDDDDLLDLLDEVETANADAPITFFEITTAAALLAFARTPADLVILEVGLGGRLDATNVISRPAITAITPVDMDHQAWLGDSLAAIAGEKAGIIKPGVPVIVGPQHDEGLAVIHARAEAVGAPVHVCGSDWQSDMRKTQSGEPRLIYRDADGILDLPAPVLAGPHQAGNAGIAIAMLRRQDALRIPEAALRAGMEWVRWPARLQKLESGPLPALLDAGDALWLDGGHNPAAARALRQALIALAGDTRPVTLVTGMVGPRDPRGFLEPFAGLAEAVHAVTVPDQDAARPASEIAAAASDLGIEGRMAADVASALKAIAAQPAAPDGRIVLICGSLYLAGSVLAANGPLPD